MSTGTEGRYIDVESAAEAFGERVLWRFYSSLLKRYDVSVSSAGVEWTWYSKPFDVRYEGEWIQQLQEFFVTEAKTHCATKCIIVTSGAIRIEVSNWTWLLHWWRQR